jgi:hypothetical protein
MKNSAAQPRYVLQRLVVTTHLYRGNVNGCATSWIDSEVRQHVFTNNCHTVAAAVEGQDAMHSFACTDLDSNIIGLFHRIGLMFTVESQYL